MRIQRPGAVQIRYLSGRYLALIPMRDVSGRLLSSITHLPLPLLIHTPPYQLTRGARLHLDFGRGTPAVHASMQATNSRRHKATKTFEGTLPHAKIELTFHTAEEWKKERETE